MTSVNRITPSNQFKGASALRIRGFDALHSNRHLPNWAPLLPGAGVGQDQRFVQTIIKKDAMTDSSPLAETAQFVIKILSARPVPMS